MKTLGLAQAAVAALRVPYSLREDALHEAAVAILESEASYDPSRGAQPTTWAVQQAKWAVCKYLDREFRALRSQPFDPAFHSPIAPDQFNWVIERDHILTNTTTAEAEIIFAYALGYPMATLSRRFREGGPQLVQRIREVVDVLRS